MFFYNTSCHSKTVHLEGCGHIRHTDKAKIGTFPNLTKAISCGYRLCKHCNLMQKRYHTEKGSIFDFCQQYGFAYRQSDRIATVTTALSKWKIVLNDAGDGLKLYHRNTFDKKGSTSMISNYHYQHATYDTIGGFLDYIFWHDIYRKNHPLEGYKKANVPPPMKGTKRYRKEKRKLEKRERRRSIANVLSLIESLQSNQRRCCTA